MLVPTSEKEMDDFFFFIPSRARSVPKTTMNGNGGLPGFPLLILQNLLVIGLSPFLFKLSRGVLLIKKIDNLIHQYDEDFYKRHLLTGKCISRHIVVIDKL